MTENISNQSLRDFLRHCHDNACCSIKEAWEGGNTLRENSQYKDGKCLERLNEQIVHIRETFVKIKLNFLRAYNPTVS